MFSSLFSKVFSPVEASLVAADVASEEAASLDAAALEDAALPQPKNYCFFVWDAAHLSFPDCTLIISGKPDLINVFPLLKDGFY